MGYAVKLLFLIVLFDAIVAFSIGIVFPDFFTSFSDTESAFWLTMTTNLFFVMQLFSAPLLGALSDKYGRKLIILVSEIGTVLSNIALLPKTFFSVFINRAVDGTTNGMYAAVNAYVSDESKPKDAAKNLGLIGAVFSFAAILGPALAFVLLAIADRFHWDGALTVVTTGIVLGLLNIVLVLLLPETKQKKQTNNRSLFGTYKRAWKYIRSRPKLFLIVLLQCILALGVGYYQFFIAFLTQSELQYTIKQAGFTLFLFGVSNTISQTLFFTKIVDKINRVRWQVWLSALGVIGMIGYSLLSVTPGMIEILIVLDSLTFSLINSLVQGFINEETEEHVRGEVFGLIQTFGSIATILTGLITAGLLLVHIRIPWVWFTICWVGVLYLARRYSRLKIQY